MRKMDEMEYSINLQSIKFSWIFGILALLIYNVSFQIKEGHLHDSFFIMISMMIIKLMSETYLRYQKGDDQMKGRMIIRITIFVLAMAMGFGLSII